MMKDLLIKNATLVTPEGKSARKGSSMGVLKIVENAFIIVREGKILYADDQIGASEALSSLSEGYKEIDAKGKVVLPGFIDSHTHLIFGGYRPDEFEWRLKGDSYMSIMERGGGIQSTVNATRKETARSLALKASWYLDKMSDMGVTTVEIKSGYGLDLENELKQLDAIYMLRRMNNKVDTVATFLGAHAVPTEYKGQTSEYVDLIISEMLPKAVGRAKFCDIFTEKNVFEIEDSRRLLNAARKLGFSLKLHADEIVQLGGAELAAELRAVSADHLLHVSDNGIKEMARCNVVATLLPLTAFALKEPFAPARKFIEAGTAVALATDLNPGSCFSGSIPLTIALACIYMNMSIEETITALTINGAAALELADSKGTVEKGKDADLIILDFDNYKMLTYYIGMNCVNTVIKSGEIIKSGI